MEPCTNVGTIFVHLPRRHGDDPLHHGGRDPLHHAHGDEQVPRQGCRRYRQHTYSNATNATCDAEPLEPPAAHFFHEPCVAALTCDDQAMLAQFMYQYLSPLRADAILFYQTYLLTNFMVVHEGGGAATVWVHES
mmetsp:Transcript_34750/g.92662  ORF Transcript_34750/g.92662 Transcript_34750/m.92662 type:complete len:135 (+) Transcript_34750:67-471(+)